MRTFYVLVVSLTLLGATQQQRRLAKPELRRKSSPRRSAYQLYQQVRKGRSERMRFRAVAKKLSGAAKEQLH